MSIGFGAIRETPQFGERTVMIPPGIPQALECLSREVIRNQPDNIVQFAADYFKYLLELRDRKLNISCNMISRSQICSNQIILEKTCRFKYVVCQQVS